MKDYSAYQGPVQEWEDFVNLTGFKNVPVAGIAAERLRNDTNAARTQAARKGLANSNLAELVTWIDYAVLTRDFQNILARVYRPRHALSCPSLPVIVHFHGGGFLYGNVESEDVRCSRIITGSPEPLMVVSINYRHTPEFQHPTQLNDAWDAFEWLSQNVAELGGDADRIIVEGISAGAGLAASVVYRQTETPSVDSSDTSFQAARLRIRGQILGIPWLIHPARNPHHGPAHSSVRQNQNAPVLPQTALSLFASLLGESAISDPYSNIGLAADSALACMPRTCVLVAGQDILRDEGLDFAERLKTNGVPTKTHVFAGLPHGFQRFESLSSVRRWDELMVESILWILREENCSTFVVGQI